MHQNSSITVEDFIYLLRYRFLDIAVIDLRDSEKEEITPILPGSFTLTSFASQIKNAPNLGSLIYAITLNDSLRQISTQFKCPYMVVYDKDGSPSGTAQTFVRAMSEVGKVAGPNKKYAKFILYLEEGIYGLSKNYPDFIENSRRMIMLESSNDETIPTTAGRMLNRVPSLPQKYYGINVSPEEDPPAEIIEKFLFLGGIQSTKYQHLMEYQIDTIISAGELPLVIDPNGTGLVAPSSGIDVQLIEENNSRAITPIATGTGFKSSCNIKSKIYRLGLPRDSDSTSNTKMIDIYYFDIEDASHAPISNLTILTNDIIHTHFKHGKKVLVHCYGGVSRSSSVIMAYLMSKYHHHGVKHAMLGQEAADNLAVPGNIRRPRGPMSLAESFATVFLKRPWVRPNDGFWQALQNIEVEERVIRAARRISKMFTRSGISLSLSSDLENKFDASPIHGLVSKTQNSPIYSKNKFEEEPLLLKRFQSEHMRRHSTSPVTVEQDVSTAEFREKHSVSSYKIITNNFLPQDSRRKPTIWSEPTSKRQSPLTTTEAEPFSPFASSSTNVYWDFGRCYQRSDRINKLEEWEAQFGNSVSSSLSSEVMRNMRTDRVRNWFMVRIALDPDDIC